LNDIAPENEFRQAVLDGLAQQQPAVPCKFLYDARGSELFEGICDSPDYYVTRADLAILRDNLGAIAEQVGAGVHLVEFGSGAGTKTTELLAALESPRAYTPIEISGSALQQSTRDLRQRFPVLKIRPLQADYTAPIPRSALELKPTDARRVVYFPGSTIGNFTRAEAAGFLSRIRRMIVPDGGLLLGVDLWKDAAILRAAYDDREGITARFNLNLLERINRELGGDFDPAAWHHEARVNDSLRRVEMHLVSDRNQVVEIDGARFEFGPGDSIHTENSHKYTVEDLRRLAGESGLEVVQTWMDADKLFSTHYLAPGAD